MVDDNSVAEFAARARESRGRAEAVRAGYMAASAVCIIITVIALNFACVSYWFALIAAASFGAGIWAVSKVDQDVSQSLRALAGCNDVRAIAPLLRSASMQ